MSLTPGVRLGPYEVTALIGHGGMGEVYRARDSKLNRDVALKVLPEGFALDHERLARFKREARVLASLSHPNIGAIFGFEESDGVQALVLEMVEGPTLAERISQRPIPLDEVLVIARQTANGIEAAHEHGIIHRDLKPANIKVRKDGTVKVLDFGLAKAATDEREQPDLSQLATITMAETRDAVILGTPAYMSPEQARGKPLDKRTDIWAFGCVLYEMLTRRLVFSGDTVADTISAILEREPDWQKLPENTPPEIRRLLKRSLEKDPSRRLHDIADARLEIEEAMVAVPAGSTTKGRTGIAGRWFVWLAIIAAAVVIATAFSLLKSSPNLSPQPVRITRLTDLAGLEEAPAISPDGRSIAFTGSVGKTSQVFVQLMARGAALQLTHDDADHQYPRWSPDSSSIIYFSPAKTGEGEGALWEVPALGGRPRRLATSLGGADVNTSNGRLTYFRLTAERIQLVNAPPDESSSDLISEFPPETYHLYSHYLYPRWSPDGKWIAFQRGDSIRFDLFVVPSSGGEPRQLTRDNSMIDGFSWLPNSEGILYSSSRASTMPYLPTLSLWEVRLSDGTLRQITSNEASYLHPDIARNGTTVVSRMQLRTDIWKFPVQGAPEENVRRGIRITNQTSHVLTPTAGPGAKEVAFLSDKGGHANLWVINTETSEQRQITDERDPNIAVGVPVWSPDGRSIAFVYSRGNPGLTFGIWLVSPDGSNLRQVANPGLGPAWSNDGKWLYYATRGSSTVPDVMMKKIPADGGAAVTVTEEKLRNVIGVDGSTVYYMFERPLADGKPEFEIRALSAENAPFRVVARIPSSRVPVWQIVNPALSPDGKWLAQALTDRSTTNIWVLSTATGEWRQVTDFEQRPIFIARRVSWSSDGREIFAAVGEGDADIVRLEGLLNGSHP
jgi:serine/threonine protein kinase/Tol biopolymer transport system component